MKSTQNLASPQSQITDVTDFFYTITEKYQYFEYDILQIISKMPEYSPQQICHECSKISEQRNSLAVMDQQMFDIMDLAGAEIAQNPMVHKYRVAFARANMACTNLHQKLKALRATLDAGSTNHLL